MACYFAGTYFLHLYEGDIKMNEEKIEELKNRYEELEARRSSMSARYEKRMDRILEKIQKLEAANK